MAVMTLEINGSISDLLQVGDQIYYLDSTSSVGGFTTTTSLDNVVHIGSCLDINTTTNMIQVDTGSLNFTPPTSGAFILFTKDNKVNMSSLLGYYGSAKFKNNSTAKAEMFTTSCEIDESSK